MPNEQTIDDETIDLDVEAEEELVATLGAGTTTPLRQVEREAGQSVAGVEIAEFHADHQTVVEQGHRRCLAVAVVERQVEHLDGVLHSLQVGCQRAVALLNGLHVRDVVHRNTLALPGLDLVRKLRELRRG